MKLRQSIVSVFVASLAVGCLVLGCKVAAPATSVKEWADSTRTEKDSTWFVAEATSDTIYLPGDTIVIDHIIECDSITNKPKEFKSKTIGKNGRLELSLKNGLLMVKSKYDSAVLLIQKNEKEIYILRKSLLTINNHKEETKTVVDYKTHWYDIWARWIAVAVVLFLLIKTIIKIYKPL